MVTKYEKACIGLLDKAVYSLELALVKTRVKAFIKFPTPLQIPSESERRAFVNSKTEPGWTALMTAAENTQVEAARWLIKNGANVNSAMTTGWTAGHAAAKKALDLPITENENQRIKSLISPKCETVMNLS